MLVKVLLSYQSVKSRSVTRYALFPAILKMLFSYQELVTIVTIIISVVLCNVSCVCRA